MPCLVLLAALFVVASAQQEVSSATLVTMPPPAIVRLDTAYANGTRTYELTMATVFADSTIGLTAAVSSITIGFAAACSPPPTDWVLVAGFRIKALNGSAAFATLNLSLTALPWRTTNRALAACINGAWMMLPYGCEGIVVADVTQVTTDTTVWAPVYNPRAVGSSTPYLPTDWLVMVAMEPRGADRYCPSGRFGCDCQSETTFEDSALFWTWMGGGAMCAAMGFFASIRLYVVEQPTCAHVLPIVGGGFGLLAMVMAEITMRDMNGATHESVVVMGTFVTCVLGILALAFTSCAMMSPPEDDEDIIPPVEGEQRLASGMPGLFFFMSQSALLGLLGADARRDDPRLYVAAMACCFSAGIAHAFLHGKARKDLLRVIPPLFYLAALLLTTLATGERTCGQRFRVSTDTFVT